MRWVPGVGARSARGSRQLPWKAPGAAPLPFLPRLFPLRQSGTRRGHGNETGSDLQNRLARLPIARRKLIRLKRRQNTKHFFGIAADTKVIH